MPSAGTSKLAKCRSAALSKGFFEFVRSIGEAKSKQEEDSIIRKEVCQLKSRVVDRSIETKVMRECILRAMYCEMLGHETEFSHIHMVNFVSKQSAIDKRVGNLQKDLGSSNILDVCAALTACYKIMGDRELMKDLPQPVMPVRALLSHQSPLVRKKAVMALQAFHRRDPNAIGDVMEYRTVLCDRDPAVMGSALYLLYDIAQSNPSSQKDLVSSFVSILKQVVEHRLPREYDYHRIPAPWTQINILRLLGLLCADDPGATDKCAEVLGEVMRRADSGLNIGHAVVFECIRTVTSVAHVPTLVELASENISRFLSGGTANLKYLGITALASIVRIDARYAGRHQDVVIECLEDSDESIRRKTVELLYAMTNRANVSVVMTRLIKYLAQTTDSYVRQDLVAKICDLADRFAPSNGWYVETINHVVGVCAQHVRDETIQGLLRLIAEGTEEDEDEDAAFRLSCVNVYFDSLGDDKRHPDLHYQVLGEYGFLACDPDTGVSRRVEIMERLMGLMDKPFEDRRTRLWIVMALTKLCAQPPPPDADPSSLARENELREQELPEMMRRFVMSRDLGLQQRCLEFLRLRSKDIAGVYALALPLDGCCEDLVVDGDLRFMDAFVKAALASGARPYTRRDLVSAIADEVGLKMEAYKPAGRTQQADESEPSLLDAAAEAPRLQPTANRWGPETEDEPVPVPRLETGSSMFPAPISWGEVIPFMPALPPSTDLQEEPSTSASGSGGGGGGPAPRKTGHDRAKEELRSALFGGL